MPTAKRLSSMGFYPAGRHRLAGRPSRSAARRIEPSSFSAIFSLPIQGADTGFLVGQAFQPDISEDVRLESLTYSKNVRLESSGTKIALAERLQSLAINVKLRRNCP